MLLSDLCWYCGFRAAISHLACLEVLLPDSICCFLFQLGWSCYTQANVDRFREHEPAGKSINFFMVHSPKEVHNQCFSSKHFPAGLFFKVVPCTVYQHVQAYILCGLHGTEPVPKAYDKKETLGLTSHVVTQKLTRQVNLSKIKPALKLKQDSSIYYQITSQVSWILQTK